MNIYSGVKWLARMALLESIAIILAMLWLASGIASYAQMKFKDFDQQQQYQQDRDLAYHQRQIDVNTEDIKSLERRLSSVEDMQLEKRMTQVETKLDTMLQILIGLCIAMGISLVEMFTRIVKKKAFDSAMGG